MLKSSKNVYKLQNMTTIGRAQDNTIFIESQLVSKYHAKIILEDMIIIDLQSKNGTYIGTTKIHNQHYKIQYGDYIKFGDYDEVFQFVENDSFKVNEKSFENKLQQINQNSEQNSIPLQKHTRNAIQQVLLPEQFSVIENISIKQNPQISNKPLQLNMSQILLEESQSDQLDKIKKIQQQTLLNSQKRYEILEVELQQLQNNYKQLQNQNKKITESINLKDTKLLKVLQQMINSQVIDIDLLQNNDPIQSKIIQLLQKQKIDNKNSLDKANTYIASLKETNTYYIQINKLTTENKLLKQQIIPFFDMQNQQKKLFQKVFSNQDKGIHKLLQDEITVLQCENSLQKGQLNQLIQQCENMNQIIAQHQNQINILRKQLGNSLNFEPIISQIIVKDEFCDKVHDLNRILSQFVLKLEPETIGDNYQILLAIAQSLT